MKNLYSVYDSINDEFAQPFMLNNDSAAKDMFIKDIKHIAKENLSKFSEPDVNRYKLYCLCSFDPHFGTIITDCTENSIYPLLVYDVEKDFDFSIFKEQIEENDKTRGLELQGGLNG